MQALIQRTMDTGSLKWTGISFYILEIPERTNFSKNFGIWF